MKKRGEQQPPHQQPSPRHSTTTTCLSTITTQSKSDLLCLLAPNEPTLDQCQYTAAHTLTNASLCKPIQSYDKRTACLAELTNADQNADSHNSNPTHQ